MSLSDCHDCHAAADSRSMTACRTCGAPLCPDCEKDGDGYCADCEGLSIVAR